MFLLFPSSHQCHDAVLYVAQLCVDRMVYLMCSGVILEPGSLKPQHPQIVADEHFMFKVVALTLKQIYFKLTMNFMIYVINLWILSVGISFIYTRFRELYQYDYNVRNLIKFLKYSDISPPLLDSVSQYTTQLWQRQRGKCVE